MPDPDLSDADDLERMLERIRDRGVVPALVPVPDAVPPRTAEVHLLVGSRAQERVAREELARGDWWVRLGERGVWRFARTVTYLWPGGPTVSLHRGVPCSPLPAAVTRRVERAIRGRLDGRGVADPVAAAVLCAFLAARPGFDRAGRVRSFRAALAAVEDPAEVRDLARRAGVGRALIWAERASSSSHPIRGGAPPADRGLGRILWPAIRLAARARPPRLRALLLATPRIGVAPSRTRFAGLELDGGPGVFVPRRMSEPLVDLAVEHLEPGDVMVEAGTGCGAVAIAVARARPDVEVHAVDTSAEAIRWARRNAGAAGVGVRWHRGSLLEPLPEGLSGRIGVIVSSVPYVAPGRWGTRDRFGAIEGAGDDGLGLQRLLAGQARGVLRRGGVLVQQLGAEQWRGFAEELRSVGFLPEDTVGGSAGDVLTWARIRELDPGRPGGEAI